MTKSEVLANELIAKISSGEIKPGELLPTENELCKSYNLSRITVRAAVQSVAAKGYITTERGRGSTVNHLDKMQESMDTGILPLLENVSRVDLFEFRRILETETAYLAAQRATTADIDAMHAITKAMQNAESNQDMVHLEIQFHSLIAKAAKNEILAKLYHLFTETYHQMFSQNISLVGYQNVSGHIEIVGAIESRNPEQAKKFMLIHLNHTMQQTSEINQRVQTS
jgi:GntR family transcriptional repressor for pyruvate dehydrogenase complex